MTTICQHAKKSVLYPERTKATLKTREVQKLIAVVQKGGAGRLNNTIAIIGIGRVGATTAYTLLLKNLVANLLLVDVNEERCEGEVRDLADALAFLPAAHIRQASYSEARTADIIIICAGFAQSNAKETRLNLAQKNRPIVEQIIKNLEPIPPHTIIILVTNPVDIMTTFAQRATQTAKNHIFGSGTWLDTQRLRRYTGEILAIAPESIDAFVIGEHGDAQCVAWSQTLVGGTPLSTNMLNTEQRNAIALKAKNEVYAIIEKKCATFFGVAACVADMCQAIIFDEKRVLPVSCYQPEYNLCLSMPAVLGKEGIERMLPITLSPNETKTLAQSAQSMHSFIEELSSTTASSHTKNRDS